ncbi:protein-tyrosine phosphatase family protein [Oryzihumus leptocrescens]|uniref:Tyrosine specific protein phosphatases domain-containing protein n=1 Tax=Oryzihumus leptocrescens TaxID=297536 RepID=A0A542ZKP5_9MICO|nr:dual specificity protein phosphatase [Oryzihumus leptocrescens]TQL60932.1 hypothetical protein FB474_2332 [Oryzihumus leptocrescens]
MPANPANISFVTDRLAVGGDLDWREAVARTQLEELVGLGVSHIVDVRVEWSDEEFVAVHAPQVRYLHHGMDDDGQRVAAAWFDTGVGWALDALEGDPAHVVLTHCHMGINRGPSLGFAVLLAQGWDPVEALDAIRAARPIAYIDYARDALRWHHARAGHGRRELTRDLKRLADWRESNNLDVVSVIRGIRQSENAG